MRRINRHRLNKTAAMVDVFKAASDPADGMFALDADDVGKQLGITRRSVLELVSALVGSGVLERINFHHQSPRWKYRLTGKPVDRRYIEVDKTGDLRIFSPAPSIITPSAPRPAPQVRRTLTAAICGDPPPGYIRR